MMMMVSCGAGYWQEIQGTAPTSDSNILSISATVMGIGQMWAEEKRMK